MKSKVFFIFLAIAGVVYFLTIHHGTEGLKEGDLAPSFSLPSREGIVTLQQFRGRVVLLNFWATWCPPCVTEMPSLDDLRKKFEGKGLEVVAVNLDEEGWQEVDRFLSKTPVGIRILLDVRGEVPNLYGTWRLPESYLIDKKGIIVKRYAGPRDWIDPKVVAEITAYLDSSQN